MKKSSLISLQIDDKGAEALAPVFIDFLIITIFGIVIAIFLLIKLKRYNKFFALIPILLSFFLIIGISWSFVNDPFDKEDLSYYDHYFVNIEYDISNITINNITSALNENNITLNNPLEHGEAGFNMNNYSEFTNISFIVQGIYIDNDTDLGINIGISSKGSSNPRVGTDEYDRIIIKDKIIIEKCVNIFTLIFRNEFEIEPLSIHYWVINNDTDYD